MSKYPTIYQGNPLPLTNGMTMTDAVTAVNDSIGTYIGNSSVPCDLDKIKTVQDLITVLKLTGVELYMKDCDEAHKYATKEWIKDNAVKATELGKTLNKGE